MSDKWIEYDSAGYPHERENIQPKQVEPESLWGWPIEEIKSAMRQWQAKHGSKSPLEVEDAERR